MPPATRGLGRQVAAPERLSSAGGRHHYHRRSAFRTSGRLLETKKFGFHTPSKTAVGGAIRDSGNATTRETLVVEAPKPKPEWQKVLYMKQPYDDNHVSKTFLKTMQLNTKLQSYTYLGLCQSATVVVQQICVAGMLFSIATLLENGAWSCRELLVAEIVLFSAYAGASLPYWHSFCDLFSGARQRVKLGAFMFTMSLVLHTATRILGWSKDSTKAQSCFLLVVHAVLCDYNGSGMRLVLEGRLPDSIALKASLLAAIILSLRVEAVLEGLLFVLLSAEMLIFLPAALARFRQHLSITHDVVFMPILVATALMVSASSCSAVLLVAFLFIFGIVGPGALLWAQRFKKQIHGPWDIAHVGN